MTPADVEPYVGVPYCEDSMDCADFVAMVQRELFGRDIQLPNGRPRGVRGQLALGELSRPYAQRTERPANGDLVLMRERGRAGHVGIYLYLAHEGWVLHSCEGTGCSVLHRVRDMASFGAPIEGYYAWV